MWLTPHGPRTIDRAEAILVREATGLIVDLVEDDDSWEFNVPVFDSLQPEQKIAVLAEVATALLERDAPALERTAVRDGTIAVIYREIETLVAAEIEEERCTGTTCVTNRARLRATCAGFEPLPAVDCASISDWVPLIRALEQRVLYDDAWALAPICLDANPELARTMREQSGLTNEYFEAIAPDPTGQVLEQVRKTLIRLIEIPAPSDSRDEQREVPR